MRICGIVGRDDCGNARERRKGREGEMEAREGSNVQNEVEVCRVILKSATQAVRAARQGRGGCGGGFRVAACG